MAYVPEVYDYLPLSEFSRKIARMSIKEELGHLTV